MTPYEISLPNVPLANALVFSFFLFLIIGSIRKRDTNDANSFLTLQDTSALKGIALLTIIAIHIGYSLAGNWQYLHPVSSLGGVGVDIFLFLSGYGLTLSMLKRPLSPIEFYKKRLFRVFLPFWGAITLLFLMDFFILRVEYPIRTIIESYLSYFPSADIWKDFDSPLWYMTWLAFFYIFFPIFFIRKHPWITSVCLYLLGLLLVKLDPLGMSTNWLHGLHLGAFPLGVLIAASAQNQSRFSRYFLHFRSRYSSPQALISIFLILFILGYILWKIDPATLAPQVPCLSSLGDSRLIIEQTRSIILGALLILFCILLPFQSSFLVLLGSLSYEIYLLHWPLMARYDIFFHTLPAWGATILWVGVLMLISWGIHRFMKKI